MKGFSVVILAAGAGTRMHSDTSKVLHKLSGKPLIGWVIDSILKLKPDNIVVVLGHKAAQVEEYLKTFNVNIKVAYQDKQLGSAHAVSQAFNELKSYKGKVIVLSGDVPLIKTETIKSLIKFHNKKNASVTVLAAKVENPFGYGRMIKNQNGELEKIVEQKDASADEKLIKEINSGIYCFDSDIWKILPLIKNNNAKKEYYLTDSIELLKAKSAKAFSYTINNEYEVKGINNRLELSEAESFVLSDKLNELMLSGVTIISPRSTYIASDAVIGQDTVIYPNVFINRNVKIGKGCTIGASSYINKSVIADNVLIEQSYINGAKIGANVKIGPFAHIRPESELKENVRVGNFSEVKKSVVDTGAKINHLSYIGDASIGKNVNVGAGTITCNYNGKEKNRTVIGEGSFVGSNVNFVAPVKIGKNAVVAAGSTITEDIPSNVLAIARARQTNKAKK